MSSKLRTCLAALCLLMLAAACHQSHPLSAGIPPTPGGGELARERCVEGLYCTRKKIAIPQDCRQVSVTALGLNDDQSANVVLTFYFIHDQYRRDIIQVRSAKLLGQQSLSWTQELPADKDNFFDIEVTRGCGDDPWAPHCEARVEIVAVCARHDGR